MGVRKPKVDWEGLSKKLQEALAKEMKETERLYDEISKLNEEIEYLKDANDSFSGENTLLTNDLKKSRSICAYLESRLVDVIIDKRSMQRAEDLFYE